MVSLWHNGSVFADEVDQLSVDEAERIARSLAHWMPDSGEDASSDRGGNSLLRALRIHDPRQLNLEALWAARRSQADPKWMMFPVGLRPNGEVQNLIIRSKDTGGFGFHGLLPGTTGSGKSEMCLSASYSLFLTHSPLVANVVFIDMKYESAAQDLEGVPHVPAALSNLGDDKRHLGERMRLTLAGELKRRYSLIHSVKARDAGVYEEIRRNRIAAGDNSLPPMPVLWIIVDEYLTLFRVLPRWVELITVLGEQGRGANMFFVLGGQRLDMSPLQKVADNIGYRIALRAESVSSSREWINSNAAAHLPQGENGHALLKVGERDLVAFRCFYLSADFVVPKPERERSTIEVAFEKPRPLTAAYQPVEGLEAMLNADADEEPDEYIVNPDTGRPKRVVDILREALIEANPEVPPAIWLPPLEVPEPVDALVARWRGKPWFVDYGQRGAEPGLPLLVGMVDIPFDHTQEVHVLDVERENIMVVGTAGTGKTPTLMTLVTSGCLLYRPQRVTFFCVGDGAFFKLDDWPHVAAVVSRNDTEGIGRMVATLEGIHAARAESFKRLKIGLDEFRNRRFYGGDGPTDPRDNFGDLFLVIDNFGAFHDEHTDLADRVVRLAELGRSYGIHVAVSQNDWIIGQKQGLKTIANARVELALSEWRSSEMDREAAERIATLNRPLFGCTARPNSELPGRELLVGVPEISDPKTGQRCDAAGAAAVVEGVAGRKHFTLKRLPAKIGLRTILDAAPHEGLLVPYAIGETALEPVSLDLRVSPNFLAVGLAECGKDELLVTLGQSLMSRLRPDEVRITVVDPKAKLTGRIDGPHVDRYCYEADDIADTLERLAAQLRARLPQAGLSQQQLQELARRGFHGPRHVLLLNDAHMLGARGQFGEKPPATAPIAELVTRASEIGLHVFATRHTGNWDSVYAMDQFVVAIKNSRAPILFMDNDPDNCTIMGRIRAPHLPPGRGILLVEEKREGVLVGLYDNES
jgi:type VII secretion protein EccCb